MTAKDTSVKEILLLQFKSLKRRLFIVFATFISFLFIVVIISFFENNKNTEKKFIVLLVIIFFVLIYRFLNKKPK